MLLCCRLFVLFVCSWLLCIACVVRCCLLLCCCVVILLCVVDCCVVCLFIVGVLCCVDGFDCCFGCVAGVFNFVLVVLIIVLFDVLLI